MGAVPSLDEAYLKSRANQTSGKVNVPFSSDLEGVFILRCVSCVFSPNPKGEKGSVILSEDIRLTSRPTQIERR